MALPTNKISLSKSGFIKSSRLIIKSPLSHTLDAPSAIRRSIYPIREGRLQEAQYGSARSRSSAVRGEGNAGLSILADFLVIVFVAEVGSEVRFGLCTGDLERNFRAGAVLAEEGIGRFQQD